MYYQSKSICPSAFYFRPNFFLSQTILIILLNFFFMIHSLSLKGYQFKIAKHLVDGISEAHSNIQESPTELEDWFHSTSLYLMTNLTRLALNSCKTARVICFENHQGCNWCTKTISSSNFPLLIRWKKRFNLNISFSIERLNPTKQFPSNPTVFPKYLLCHMAIKAKRVISSLSLISDERFSGVVYCDEIKAYRKLRASFPIKKRGRIKLCTAWNLDSQAWSGF